MAELFLRIVNMSISASWLVLAVVALRFLLKSSPKWATVLLWGMVALRLLCPFTLESTLSLIPSAETISPEIMMERAPAIDSGVEVVNSAVNPIITESFTPEPAASANPLQILIPVLAAVWCAGMALMMLYTFLSYHRLRRQVRTAVRVKENIYLSEYVTSPFVLGIFRPRIYLPYHMSELDRFHVLAHERTHIRRKDHWWKPLGFLLLTIHWFNPLIWLAYILLCRDIELACDEKVIKELGVQQRADYSQALLNCTVNRRSIAACPIAFGEVDVKERVKNVLTYKKPGFWIILIAIIACILVAVCFLTDPVEDTPEPTTESTPLSVNDISITAENVTPTGMTVVYEPDRAFANVNAITELNYWLESYNSGEWATMQPSQWVEPIFETIEAPTDRTIHTIMTSDINRHELDWSGLYGNLSPGIYRIGISFSDRTDSAYQTLYAEFTLDSIGVTPYSITSTLSAQGCQASAAFVQKTEGVNGYVFFKEETEELVGILNALTEEDFIGAAVVNPQTVITLHSANTTVELSSDGSYVEFRTDKDMEDVRWGIYSEELNAFFAKINAHQDSTYEIYNVAPLEELPAA